MTEKLLSILIPTTPDREKVLYELLSELHNQIEKGGYDSFVEILVETDNKELSVGKKRQMLLEKARGKYVIFIDDDDEVSEDYLSSILEVIEKDNPDVIGFTGFMTTNGIKRENFKISRDFPYTTITDTFGNNEYLRFNNHISPIKREIALKVGFKDMVFGEDYDYAKRLKESGLVKTETYINKDLYHYKYIYKK
jgi:glycosyltransferase involved in cell wall biosynthesis